MVFNILSLGVYACVSAQNIKKSTEATAPLFLRTNTH